MKKQTIIFLALAFILAAACTQSFGVLYFRLDTPFELKQGDIATLEDNSGIKIQFTKVLADSRCPANADCIWAGRVEVEIIFTQAGASDTSVLIMGDNNGTDYTEKAVFGDYTVTLKKVKPENMAGQPIPASQYGIELVVKKAL